MKRVFKIVALTLFLLFLGLYISSNAKVIDYEARNKYRITEEKIKEFEKDIEDNKEIDIKKYLDDKNDIYNTKLSETTLNLSKTISNTAYRIIDFIFSKIEKTLN